MAAGSQSRHGASRAEFRQEIDLKLSQQPAGNLPAELTSFVGRRSTLAQIKGLLAHSRLLTLTGAGGVGKSRTAVEVARQLARAWPDGTWLVELAGLGEPELLPNAVAAVLGVREQPGRPIQATLANYLEQRQLLLVLDNCEHLLEASAAFCHALLRGCPGLRVLATSRQPLGISGEATLALAPMDVPDDAQPATPASLMRFDGIRLFVERAATVSPGFVLTDENQQAVIALTRKLDGIPLGLELAAVLVRTLALGDLVERLDDRFSLLNVGNRAALQRHQTLRAAIDWSHDLLSEAERILWRRLSVFAGGFSLDAAEAVCVDDLLPAKTIVTTLTSLVEKSIVSADSTAGVSADSAAGRGRYRMLETLRQYAHERLHEANEAASLLKAHYNWCAALVLKPAGAWWTGRRQIDWLALMKAEQFNLRAALDVCLRDPDKAEAGLNLAAHLFLHWIVQNSQGEARHYIDGLLAQATAPSAARAGALFAQGFIARGQGDLDCARASYEECHRLALAHGYERELGWSIAGMAMQELVVLATIEQPAERSARFLKLQADLNSAVELLARSGDSVIRIWAIYLLGDAHAHMGDLARAEAFMKDSVALSEAAGDVWARANARARLGIVQWQRGELESAREHLQQAIVAQREIGHRWGMAMSLEGLAYVSASAGQPEKAARLLGAVDTLWNRVGTKLHGFMKAHHDRCAAAASEALGEARFQDNFQRGATMALPEVLAYVLGEPETAAPARPEALALLSRREMEVAHLIAGGATNREIAAALFVAERTVKTHIEHILNKLGVGSRAQVAVWLTQHQRPGKIGPTIGQPTDARSARRP
jgi:non-specific serine/threonine protein kinase